MLSLPLWVWLAGSAFADTPLQVSPLQPLSGPEDSEVQIEVQVSALGFLERIEVVGPSGFPNLDQIAMEQVLDASFEPAKTDAGAPIRSAATITIPITGPTADDDEVLFFDSDEVVFVDAPEEPEVSEIVVTIDDIRYLPGSGGDVVRTVQNLPGVARPPFNLGQLLIRGTAPEDSGYFLDGMRIPIVFHFGGISTVVNGDFLEDVRFRSGGYSVRYGGLLGGVVDLRASGDLPERSRAYASVDLFQATAFAEVRSDRWAFTASARRSYIDQILQPILDTQVDQPVQAPRFWDTQFRVMHDPVGPEKLDVLLVVSNDKFLVFDQPLTEDEEVDPNDTDLAIGINFAKGRVRYTREGAGPWRGEVTVQAGPELQTFEVAPAGVAVERAFAGSLRGELERKRGDDPLGVLAGVEARVESLQWAFDVPTFGLPDSGDALSATVGAYGEMEMGFGPVELISGARADVRVTDGPSLVQAIDPRARLKWSIDAATDFEASIGQYSQFPTLRQVEPFSSQTLGPLTSSDISVGVFRELSNVFDVRATGFTKQLSRLVVGRQDSFEFFTTPPQPGPIDSGVWANEGRGSVWGFEFQLRAQTARTVGWLSATLSRSLRVDRRDGERYVFDYDQPINLVALASHQLGKGWRLGGRARFASGTPYTAVARSNFGNLDAGVRIPVYGPRNEERLNPYFALDIRVDKEFVFNRWVLSTYLDLTNVMNRSNQELMSFTPSLEERPITGLPIVPAFGIRADF